MHNYCEVFPVSIFDNLLINLNFFSKPVQSNLLAEHQQTTTGTRVLLQLPAKTRWFSVWTLFSTILKYEDALKSAIWDSKLPQDVNSKKKRDELQKLICTDEDFWPKLKLISDVLKPLARAIKEIEGSNVDFRIAYRSVNFAFTECLNQVEKFAIKDQTSLKNVSF